MTDTYNGWTNYETWAVNLWIENEQGDHEYWRERTRERVESKQPSKYGYLTLKENASYELAEDLHDYVLDNSPLAHECHLYSDLLSAALSEVNWHEIASNWVETAMEEREQEASV